MNQSIPNAPVSNTAPVRIEEWNEAEHDVRGDHGLLPRGRLGDVGRSAGKIPARARRAALPRGLAHGAADRPRVHGGRQRSRRSPRRAGEPSLLDDEARERPERPRADAAHRRAGGPDRRCDARVVPLPRSRRRLCSTPLIYEPFVLQSQQSLDARLRPPRARRDRRAGARRSAADPAAAQRSAIPKPIATSASTSSSSRTRRSARCAARYGFCSAPSPCCS